MPSNWKSIAWIVTVIAATILTLVAIGRCRPEKPCPPEGMTLVSDGFIDSLRAVAEKPPKEIVKIETVVKDTIIYIVKNNPPIFVDLPSGGSVYMDSVQMIEDGINAWVKITARGVVDQIMWGYKPVYKTITKEIRIPEPYPVDVIKPVPMRGLLFEGGVGVGPNQAGFSLGLRWQQRNSLSYGVDVIQFNERFYMVKIGYKLF